MTTLDELEWFVVLAETEHMTRAAEKLSVAQPTLSRALGRLERQVGAPLFDRVARRLRLNASGEIMLEHARRSLAELAAAGDRIATLRDPDHGTVRLAFLHSIAAGLTPEMLRAYRSHAPGVVFELTQAAGHEIIEHVRAGRADLGLTAPRPDDDELAWTGLYRQQLCLAVPADHRLAGRPRVALSAAGTDPFVALRAPIGLRRLTDELCARAGLSPRFAFESTEIGTLEGFVSAGLGVAIVPEPRPDRAEPGVSYVPLTDATAHRSIGLTWLRERPAPPVVARFADFVVERYRDRAPGTRP
ncbi:MULTISPECIES: LysR family transcriptional regulator [unclassified Pseudonocardia]|uniref:LysR family transcriptional regulator n=1 Tax=unclassified Pseudonocardia TaxID=2619320 RepID=UPI0001FFE8B9|nr:MULTISPECIES: LysR family transcriptional regulator [unclassified Pseudonocardia]ALE74764.1 LysR family transcriptional regulator [Pseudonocardia sp. EC080625-04]OLM16795.1 LysR family transcriptional regulator Bsu YybE [Pseudonocardia sp. Ae707_Ps1]